MFKTNSGYIILWLVFALVSILSVDLPAQSKYKKVAQTNEPAIIFHDAEPLIGQIGGQYKDDPPNTIFRLVDIPKPFASLILVSDGRVLVQGIDFLLDNKGYVEINLNVAPKYKGTLVAWYRTESK